MQEICRKNQILFTLFAIIPVYSLWIISGVGVFTELFRIICTSSSFIKKGTPEIFTGAFVCFLLCFCIFGWNAKIQHNWSKEDMRGVVNAWYKQNAAEKYTLVYYAADSGFAYYVKKDGLF